MTSSWLRKRRSCLMQGSWEPCMFLTGNKGANMQVKTGWEKDMEALMERTRKNWKKTGKVKKSSGVTGSVCLGNKGRK